MRQKWILISLILVAYAVLSAIFFLYPQDGRYVLVIRKDSGLQVTRRGTEEPILSMWIYLRVENHGYEPISVGADRFSRVFDGFEIPSTDCRFLPPTGGRVQNATLADGEVLEGLVFWDMLPRNESLIARCRFTAHGFFPYTVRYGNYTD